MGDWNRRVFEAVNGLPQAFGPFLRFFTVGMNYVAVKIALGLLVVALCWRPGAGRRAAVQALIAFPIANGFTDLFKHGLPTERPCNALNNVMLHGIGCTESMGTASAHSANMAAVAFVFVYHLRWWGSPWVLVALITGVSRVYVGAHFPDQVLLGWVCGLVAGALVTRGWRFVQRRGNRDLPAVLEKA